MMIHWQEIFSKQMLAPVDSQDSFSSNKISNLPSLKHFLDAIHIRHGLVRPYQENGNYPIVEARELLPSFENDMYEYKNLPAFSLVAFGRQLDYFSEIFQFDKLDMNPSPEPNQNALNVQTFTSRLPRAHQELFHNQFHKIDITQLEFYDQLMPYLLNLDRGHVLAWDSENHFHLSGIFASFPSDLDSELKRFGIRIGKFSYGDNELYEKNRMFVYQYLMELYGFPIVSERRASSALFARKLHKTGEHFLLRVLSQTDRTITTYTNDNNSSQYPQLEKIALVKIDDDLEDAVEQIGQQGYFLDSDKRVVILRVRYRQHNFDPTNIRQDRALSVASQEILHPLTGEALDTLNIIKDSSNMLLRLNDIVRGEFTGKIVYKRSELIENTDTDEKKLKFLYSWFTKHQRRIISYSDDFFARVTQIIASYLYAEDNLKAFESQKDLYQEVCSKFSYIQQARRVAMLEEIGQRLFHGKRITYQQMLQQALSLLNDLKFEAVNYFPILIDDLIACMEKILHDAYLRRKYLSVPEGSLSKAGQEIRKCYGRLVTMLDDFKIIRKNRISNDGQ